MPRRKVRHRPLKKYPIGDMRERITLHVRAITEPDFDSAEFTETYDEGVECWAMVETPTVNFKGQNIFDGVNINEAATHVFIIRFDSEFTAQNMIKFEGETYDILPIDNPDRRDEYLILPARLLGNSDLRVNE